MEPVMIRVSATTLFAAVALATSGSLAQELSADDQYTACVLGTAAVHLKLAKESGDPSIAADGSMFTPEIFVEKAYDACEPLRPSPEAEQDPARQDFVFTSLMNMFFSPNA
jgi:hypothetical protein